MTPTNDDDRDAKHLQLLATFHYVVAAMTCLFGCLPLLHVAMGIALLEGRVPFPFPGLPTLSTQTPTPHQASFGWIFVVAGGVTFAMAQAMAVATLYSGRQIHRRRHHLLSQVVAALLCMAPPIGTALGVFTLIVLQRDSVKELYGLRRSDSR